MVKFCESCFLFFLLLFCKCKYLFVLNISVLVNLTDDLQFLNVHASLSAWLKNCGQSIFGSRHNVCLSFLTIILCEWHSFLFLIHFVE